MNSLKLKVDGIKNKTEKLHIKKALDKLEGVQEVAIDRAESQIDIEYNPPSTEQEIIECIEHTGLDVEKL